MIASMKTVCLALLGFLVCQACVAEEPPPPPEPYRPDSAAPAPIGVREVPLAEVLKDLVAKSLPHDVAFEKNDNWGHQAHVPALHGVKVVEVLRNHGNWQKMKAVCQDVPHSIRLWVHDLHYGPDRVVYTVDVHLPAVVEYEHKIWQNGLQVQGSHGRATVLFKSVVTLEARIKFDGKGEMVAEAVSDLRVANASIVCTSFVADNVNGVGGELAKLVDGKMEHAFNDWKPALERDLQAKVRQAVLQAGQAPSSSLAVARAANAISARMATLAQQPPFSSAIVQDGETPQPTGPLVIQAEPCVGSALLFFMNLQLNGRSGGAGAASPPGSMDRLVHGGGSSFHFEHSPDSSSHGGHESSSSSSGSSSHHEDHPHSK